MVDALRSRRSPAAMEVAGGEERSAKDENVDDSAMAVDLDVNFEAEVSKLRGQWELASVLNFLNVSLFSRLHRLYTALISHLSQGEEESSLNIAMVIK